MLYSEGVIEEVRIRNDIFDVVSEYVKLEKKGKYFFGLCPFHNEKTASFSITPSKQIYYCHGCGSGGNVFNFIMNIENFTFVDALKYLAQRANYNLPESGDKKEAEFNKLKASICDINKCTAVFYHENLKKSDNNNILKYLTNRGLNTSTIMKFGIGYSSNGWGELYNYLIAKGYSDELLFKSGLVLKNKNGGYFDRFRNRVMFPIFDVTNKVIGFGGRVVNDSTPKYMNSPETVVYNKRKNLYNLNYAKKKGSKRMIITEGYMDVLSLFQSGVENVVASLGTALTEDQVRLLKKYTEEVVIAYDADNAGQVAALKAVDLFDRIGCNVRVLKISDGKDPDEYIRMKGVDRFRKLMESSLTNVEFRIRNLEEKINTETTEGKVKFIKSVAGIISKIESNVELEMYAKKISSDYKISENAVLSEIKAARNPGKSLKLVADKKGMASTKSNAKRGSIAYNEKLLICILVVNNILYGYIKSNFGVNDFECERLRKLAKKVYEKLDKKEDISMPEFFNMLESDEIGEYSKIIHKECDAEYDENSVKKFIEKIKNIRSSQRKDEILKMLKDASELRPEEVKNLTEELSRLVAMRNIRG